MKNRLFAATAAFAALMAATPAFAEMDVAGGQVSATIGATTNYIHRGISRSDDQPAVNAEAQYTHNSGFYGGAGASSIDLQEDDDAKAEMVLFGGYKGNYDDRLSYKVEGSYYVYPGADEDDLDYFELAASADYNFDVFQAGLGVAYSPDYINGSGFSAYYSAHAAVPLPYDLTLKGKLGFQFVDDEDSYITSDYTDWAIGLAYTWEEIDFLLQYTDVSLDDNECAEECGANIRLNVSYSF